MAETKNNQVQPQQGSRGFSPEELSRLKKKSKEDFYFFAKGILGFDRLSKTVHLPLCRKLQKLMEIKRLKIMLPRGWYKTTICSQAFPVWMAIRNPNVRILLVQNTYTNACAKLRVMDAIFKSSSQFPLFHALFPELLPDKTCTWKEGSMCVKRTKAYNEATFEAAGTSTQATSRHYDLIIEDDTVAPDQDQLTSEVVIPSKDDIEQAIGYHRLITPLMDDPGTSMNLVVGTRWYHQDLLQWIDENEPDFVRYERAAREDSKGRPDPRGEPAFPERFPPKVLAGLEQKLGPYMYSCLYLNIPQTPDQMAFKPEWFRFYDVEPKKLIVNTTVDPAGDPEDSKGTPDYNVVLTTGVDITTGNKYVLDYWRKRATPSELINAIFEAVRKWSPVKVSIENVAYQNTIKHYIKLKMRETNEYFMVTSPSGAHTRKSKNAKILGLQPYFASGSVFIRTWMKDLMTELQAFPLGANDDIADALSTQVELWRDVKISTNKKTSRAQDPRSLDWALENLRSKHEKSRGGVFQPSRMKGIISWN